MSAFAQSGQGSGGVEPWELRVCETRDNLPYSSESEPGFETLIAEILADELGASPYFVWLPHSHATRLEEALLREGECDVFMGVADGQDPFLTSIAYYQSSFMFVQREGADVMITSLDDPELKTLRVGVVRATPPDFALAERGIVDNVRHFLPMDEGGAIDTAVASGNIDVGIAWGPTASYFSQALGGGLVLTPVSPEIDMPFLPMVLAVSIGVRSSDVALRDVLNLALAARWDDVQAVLEQYHVPLMPLPRPSASQGGI